MDCDCVKESEKVEKGSVSSISSGSVPRKSPVVEATKRWEMFSTRWSDFGRSACTEFTCCWATLMLITAVTD